MCCTRLAGNTGRKNGHFGTIAQLCRAISSQLRHISTIGKILLSSNISSTCLRDIVNFGLLAAEIIPLVWGTPANFNGFRVSRLGSVTARHSSSGRQPNFAALNRGRHLYSGVSIRPSPHSHTFWIRLCTATQAVQLIFGQPFVKLFALCYAIVVCPVCNVGVWWPNGWMDQDTWYGGRPRPSDIVLDRDQLPHGNGHSGPTFRPMSIVPKRSPASVTAGLLFPCFQ